MPLVLTVENTGDDRTSQGSQPSNRPSPNILCHPTKSQNTNFVLSATHFSVDFSNFRTRVVICKENLKFAVQETYNYSDLCIITMSVVDEHLIYFTYLFPSMIRLYRRYIIYRGLYIII